ncbi:hypothetical protein [Clostridium butyricum]|nr:hypothetical protein [Clostridium butyricum]MDB2150476.1 hypothetical protein [Clostridium butyricum]
MDFFYGIKMQMVYFSIDKNNCSCFKDGVVLRNVEDSIQEK